MTLANPINRCTVEKSYKLLALLAVCQHSANYIANQKGEHVNRAAAALANVLELAEHMAAEIHDETEHHWLADLTKKPMAVA